MREALSVLLISRLMFINIAFVMTSSPITLITSSSLWMSTRTVGDRLLRLISSVVSAVSLSINCGSDLEGDRLRRSEISGCAQGNFCRRLSSVSCVATRRRKIILSAPAPGSKEGKVEINSPVL